MVQPEPSANGRSVSTAVRAGIGTILFGLLLDLNEHAVAVSAADMPSASQHAAHLVVLIGMLLVLAAIVRDGMSSGRRVSRLDRSTADAVR